MNQGKLKYRCKLNVSWVIKLNLPLHSFYLLNQLVISSLVYILKAKCSPKRIFYVDSNSKRC